MNTRYLGKDVISYPVNAIFQVDPLAGISSMLADRTLLGFFWPLILMVPVTLLFGRLFCGWICPMGSVLDLFGRGSRVKAPAPDGHLSRTGEILLVVLLAASLFSLNLSGIFDPLSLLIRSLTMGVVPPLERLIAFLFDGMYAVGDPVRGLSEPIYGWLLDHVMSFQLPAFRYMVLFLGLMLAIVALEIRERRFWCRNLCPLGALHGWFSAFAPLGLKIQPSGCSACGDCVKVCRMGAIREDGILRIDRKACTLCYDCQDSCGESSVGHAVAVKAAPGPGLISLTRRQALTAVGSGFLIPLVTGPGVRADSLPQYFIRPPGSVPEGRFVSLCLRCGECMRVCLTNGLQPALFEAGLEGFWTPRLISRTGYCEYSCTLCGQVCPTGAITPLDPVAKRTVRIGTAVIDKKTCIPFIRPEQCLVCEEHCPTPKKAIVFDDVVMDGPQGPMTLKQPLVVDDLCIGCGICETKCPLEGESAIRMIRQGEDRAKD